ncbi:MAG: hypothetical protein A2X25_06805 [Chloroflexi bacterium GWB2_49_20]|nr:MAG: hypothetical protein A2X25_06805 [Chloroflexi bacterium GWB2_49_20]OGN80251.1 MAG: hypothetical protein A2X26_07970 [Chloroflexi bacterium GWC2_49_37]OGN86108.1 MAG: hypothetical protein A2X27_00770 [Chloroflexi bacterium GWD2_49_16]HCC79413.1 hypothetical protein [Anaerolineae bacterium]HCM96366.1 hypothetical protein [Anaerolineae bacterium]
MIFLIEYNRKEGKILKLQTYADSDRRIAENARLEMELSLLRSGCSLEVVLLEANSQEDLLLTHRRYFENPEEIAST